MDYAYLWCMICGQPCGYCEHEDCIQTEDEAQAFRIRQIYLGIEIEPGNRTEK